MGVAASWCPLNHIYFLYCSQSFSWYFSKKVVSQSSCIILRLIVELVCCIADFDSLTRDCTLERIIIRMEVCVSCHILSDKEMLIF